MPLGNNSEEEPKVISWVHGTYPPPGYDMEKALEWLTIAKVV